MSPFSKWVDGSSSEDMWVVIYTERFRHPRVCLHRREAHLCQFQGACECHRDLTSPVTEFPLIWRLLTLLPRKISEARATILFRDPSWMRAPALGRKEIYPFSALILIVLTPTSQPSRLSFVLTNLYWIQSEWVGSVKSCEALWNTVGPP